MRRTTEASFHGGHFGREGMIQLGNDIGGIWHVTIYDVLE